MATNETLNGKPVDRDPSLTRGLRLATPEDLPRLGLVGAAGFYHSPFFAYQRPALEQYPQDTVADYEAKCLKALLDPSRVLIVAEDDPVPDERSSVYGALQTIYAGTGEALKQLPARGQPRKVIVGYIEVSLENNPQRLGTYQTHSLSLQDLKDDPKNLHRDRGAQEGFNTVTEVDKHIQRCLDDTMQCMFLVVHPAYIRRGHARRLVQWWIDLADLDQIEAGVCASAMGKHVYEALGFHEVTKFECRGYDKHPSSIWAHVEVRPRDRDT